MHDLGSCGEGSNPSRLINLFYADIAQLEEPLLLLIILTFASIVIMVKHWFCKPAFPVRVWVEALILN